MDVHTAQLGHEPVCATGRNAPQPEIIDPLLAPPADDVVTLADLLQENRNVGRVVLQVSVHGDDVLAPGMVKPRGKRRGLAKIPP